jgi:hypothetical protein
MIKPLSLDVIEGEFSEDYKKAWVLQAKSGDFLVIPDNRFPGRHPIRFFMSEADAQRVLDAVLDVKPEMHKANRAGPSPTSRFTAENRERRESQSC